MRKWMCWYIHFLITDVFRPLLFRFNSFLIFFQDLIVVLNSHIEYFIINVRAQFMKVK